MKNKKVLVTVIIIVIVVSVIATGIGIYSLVKVLSKTKTSITVSEFKEFMESKGYMIKDSTEKSVDNENLSQLCVAYDENNYQIEFYVFENEQSALNFFTNNKSNFEVQSGLVSSSYATNINNYNIYAITTNGTYRYLARVDNTVIYVDEDVKYKDNIKGIVDELGY